MLKKQHKEYKNSFFINNNKGDYMAKTGITRRIDELGRLVIPKEIRNNLKIKNNDQVEISVIDNKIVLSKFNILDIDKVISYLLKCIRKTINKNVLLTSRDEIIDYSLNNKEKIDKKELSKDIVDLIERRKEVINFKLKEYLYNIYPVIINGDLYGSLIIYDFDEIRDTEAEIIKFSKMFLENYLE